MQDNGESRLTLGSQAKPGNKGNGKPASLMAKRRLADRAILGRAESHKGWVPSAPISRR